MTTNKPYPIKNHDYVVAKIDNIAKPQYKFNVNETLKGKKIVGLTFHPNDYLTRTPEGDTLVEKTVSLNKGFLVLKDLSQRESFNRVPLYLLCAGVNTGGTYEKAFPVDHLTIDWEASYVQMSETNILTLNEVFMISVWYEDGTQACK